MQPESVLIYERVLKGEYWPPKYIGTSTSSDRTKEILRYVFFEKYNLKDFEEAKAVLNYEFLVENKLIKVVSKIPKPPELLPDEYDHILWVLFPERKKGRHALVIKVYSEVLSGKRNNFPRGYFSDAKEGVYRAETCIKYLCKKILHFSGDKIAREFSHSNGIKTLARYKLKIVLTTVYTSLSDMMYRVYPHLCPFLKEYQHQQDLRHFRK